MLRSFWFPSATKNGGTPKQTQVPPKNKWPKEHAHLSRNSQQTPTNPTRPAAPDAIRSESIASITYPKIPPPPQRSRRIATPPRDELVQVRIQAALAEGGRHQTAVGQERREARAHLRRFNSRVRLTVPRVQLTVETWSLLPALQPLTARFLTGFLRVPHLNLESPPLTL